MIVMKQKDIRELAENYYVNDITKTTINEGEQESLECVAVSHGQYGNNGAVFIGRDSGQVYTITARCANLNRFV